MSDERDGAGSAGDGTDTEDTGDTRAQTAVVTRNVCTNEAGEMVLEAYTTMMGHEGDHSISVKWDPKSGQVMRKAVGD